jgi:hypothetical protein
MKIKELLLPLCLILTTLPVAQAQKKKDKKEDEKKIEKAVDAVADAAKDKLKDEKKKGPKGLLRQHSRKSERYDPCS